jgi:6-phosphogluconolactonase
MRKLIGIVGLLLAASPAASSEAAPGAAYIASNSTEGNEILVFARAADGMLTLESTVATEGIGTGSGLSNQGGLRLTPDGRFVLVVNAGSDDVSVFRVSPAGLQLTDRTPSGGRQPVSVTIDGSLVYVLNAGGGVGDVDNVSGFHLGPNGELQPIAGSKRPLSAASTGPAQVEFSPDGRLLVVSERATNLLDVFEVSDDGLLSQASTFPSEGATPFGFAFGHRSRLFVSEASGGAPDASAVSSYEFDDGAAQAITSSAPTTETAACWLVVTNNGRYLYVTNTGSGSVSGFAIGQDGTLALLNADGRTGTTGPGPIDAAFSQNSRYLYTLNSGNGTVTIFRVHADGSLSSIDTVTGLPLSSNGLAAR